MASSSSVALGIWLSVMSSTFSRAISCLARATVRPSPSSSASSAASVAEKAPDMLPSTARTAASMRAWSGGGGCAPSGISHHLLDLVAQRLGVERLDDVVGDAGLLGGDHVLRLALGG